MHASLTIYIWCMLWIQGPKGVALHASYFQWCVLQLEDESSLFDYDVGLNDVIQLVIRPPSQVSSGSEDDHINAVSY